MQLELSDHSDSRVSVSRLVVCHPELLCSHVCGCVGHLIIFRQIHYSEDGDETSRDHKELSLVKWVVMIPGTNVYKPGTYFSITLEIAITHRNQKRLI